MHTFRQCLTNWESHKNELSDNNFFYHNRTIDEIMGLNGDYQTTVYRAEGETTVLTVQYLKPTSVVPNGIEATVFAALQFKAGPMNMDELQTDIHKYLKHCISQNIYSVWTDSMNDIIAINTVQ